MATNQQSDPNKELTELILVLVGLAAVAALWKAKIRPWLDDTWASLGRGESFQIGSTSWDTTDLIGLGALAVAVVAAFLIIRSRLRLQRARRERRKREKERERGEQGW